MGMCTRYIEYDLSPVHMRKFLRNVGIINALRVAITIDENTAIRIVSMLTFKGRKRQRISTTKAVKPVIFLVISLMFVLNLKNETDNMPPNANSHI